jgi:hypothetical protein
MATPTIDSDNDTLVKGTVQRYPNESHCALKDESILFFYDEADGAMQEDSNVESEKGYALIIRSREDYIDAYNVTYFSADTPLSDIYSDAINRVDDDSNSVQEVFVAKAIDKMYAGRRVYKGMCSFVFVCKADSYKIDDDPATIQLSELEKAGTEAQSIIFPKDKYTVAQARTWLKSHKRHSGKVDTTENYHRFRQFDPKLCSTTPKTISLGGNGIKAIICVKKTEKSDDSGVETDKSNENLQKLDIIHEVSLLKGTLTKGLVYGVVYSPDVIDTQGDYTSAEEIEKAAHEFLPAALRAGGAGWTDINHSQPVDDVEIVESYIAPCEISFDGGETVSKGSWIIAAKVNNEALKADILANNITGFSLEGRANRV